MLTYAPDPTYSSQFHSAKTACSDAVCQISIVPKRPRSALSATPTPRFYRRKVNYDAYFSRTFPDSLTALFFSEKNQSYHSTPIKSASFQTSSRPPSICCSSAHKELGRGTGRYAYESLRASTFHIPHHRLLNSTNDVSMNDVHSIYDLLEKVSGRNKVDRRTSTKDQEMKECFDFLYQRSRDLLAKKEQQYERTFEAAAQLMRELDSLIKGRIHHSTVNIFHFSNRLP